MPFAPSIQAEFIDAVIVNPKNISAPYMTIGFDSTSLAREQIPASLHRGDQTVRPQAVYKETNPDYWELIDAFRVRSGIPALLNTSLNLHGEPMNYSAGDAGRTVALSGLDLLALPGRKLVVKRAASDRIKAILNEA